MPSNAVRVRADEGSNRWVWVFALLVAAVIVGACGQGESENEPFTFTESCTRTGSESGFAMFDCTETSSDPRFAGTTRLWYSTTGAIFELSNDEGSWLGTGTPIGDGTWKGSGYGRGGYEGFQYRYQDGPPTFTVTIAPTSAVAPPTFATTESNCTSSSEPGYRYECGNSASDARFEGTKLLSGNASFTQGTFKVTNDGGTWSGMWRKDSGLIDAIGVGAGEYGGLSVRFEGQIPSFTGTIEPIG